jgi:hypothetical protein
MKYKTQNRSYQYFRAYNVIESGISVQLQRAEIKDGRNISLLVTSWQNITQSKNWYLITDLHPMF